MVALLFAIVALTNVPLAVVTAYGALAFVVALTLARKSGVAPMARFMPWRQLWAPVGGIFPASGMVREALGARLGPCRGAA